MNEILNYFTAPKIIGLICASSTVAYLIYFTSKYKGEFWQAIKGENGKLDTIEAILIVWLVLFVSMILSDFALGLHASNEAWYSMDAIFLFATGTNAYKARVRKEENKNIE